MGELASIMVWNFVAVMAAMTLLWLLSLPLRNVSIVDIFWGPGFALVALVTFAIADGLEARKWLLTVLVGLWALRLGAYLAWRNIGHGEDPRYVEMRRRAENAGRNFAVTSLWRVFYLQGAVMWFIALPVQAGQTFAEPAALGWVAWLGTAVFATGFFFEAVGDWQLARFKADPANAGRIMDRGLWRYTRHPNYFGNACIWWGIFIVAAENPWGIATVLSPLAMNFLLLKVSGVALLEKSMHETKPRYRDYVEKTSAFVPRPPAA